MGTFKKIIKELKTIARTAAYFAIVFILMMVLKKLYLEDYNIEFVGLSQALIGALIMSKVILLMELISLGPWVQSKPPIVDVILRTLLYSLGVLVVMILEKAFEARHEAGGFVPGISYVFNHRDIYHVWANTIGAVSSIFVYNAFSIIQRMMGEKGLANLYLHTSLNKVEHADLIDKKIVYKKA